MSDKIKIIVLRPFSEIIRVYSGRPGCRCGCQGNYWPNDGINGIHTNKDKSMFKRVQKIFEENLSEVYSWENSKNKFVCLDLTSTRRTYTIYYE